jgi:bifunctional DNA-binding transcriptional regulator/antitoxin component of YhaV-PrlF toxin-antitoxin module
MGNVPQHSRSIRRLTKNSNGTVSVSIPIEYAYELGWSKGQKVTVERRGKKVVIKPVEPDSPKETKK